MSADFDEHNARLQRSTAKTAKTLRQATVLKQAMNCRVADPNQSESRQALSEGKQWARVMQKADEKSQPKTAKTQPGYLIEVQ